MSEPNKPMSLADIRQSPLVGRPERSYQLCLAPKIVAKIEALDAEFFDAHAREQDGAAPKRVGDSSRAKEIAEEQDKLREQMAQHTGALVVRGKVSGEWRQWCEEHPAREDNIRDKEIGLKRCNADDLVSSLGDFAVSYNGEDLAEGDWEYIYSNAAGGDLDSIATIVVLMQEQAVNVPKSRLAWLKTQQKEPDST